MPRMFCVQITDAVRAINRPCYYANIGLVGIRIWFFVGQIVWVSPLEKAIVLPSGDHTVGRHRAARL